MKQVVLALGSNVGDRAGFIEKSCALIDCRVGKVVRVSRVYETAAWGFEAPPFLNQVLVVETELSPDKVLAVTQQIEMELGRTVKSGRTADGAPVYHNRTIDIDLLMYEDAIVETEQLTLPHPHIAQREFVLLPLAELFGDTVVPPFTISFQQMLTNIVESIK